MDDYAMISLAVVGLTCVCFLIAPPWIYLYITRTRRQRPLLKRWDKEIARTDLLDVIVVLLIYLTSHAMALLVVVDLEVFGTPAGFNPILITPLNSAAGLSVMAGGFLTFTLVYLRRQDLRVIQFRLDRLGQQVVIGLITTVCVLPAILLLNGIVSVFITIQKDIEFNNIIFRIFSFKNAPPPNDIIELFFFKYSRVTNSSSFLKNDSPFISKISKIFILFFFSIILSIS